MDEHNRETYSGEDPSYNREKIQPETPHLFGKHRVSKSIGLMSIFLIAIFTFGTSFMHELAAFQPKSQTFTFSRIELQNRSIQTVPPADLVSGTWQGHGTYLDGRQDFDMTLKVTVSGNLFSGTLEESIYNSTVKILGRITQTGNTIQITFTDYESLNGGQIALNCTYNAVIFSGEIGRGTWTYPGNSSPDGRFSLNKVDDNE